MPAGTQSKILRVLVDQAFQRVGGAHTVRVDVRVISATTRDLAREVQAGRFRTELYHRLNVVPVSVPGLEARREDIPELARHFLEELNATQGLPLRTLAPEAEAQLQTMRWPGNVRQLRNTLERALILGPDHGPIEPEELVLEMPPERRRRQRHARRRLRRPGAPRGARDVRARVPGRADQPLRRQHLADRELRRHGALGLHRKLKSLNVISAGRSDRTEEAEAHA